jgi:hypothetical protein
MYPTDNIQKTEELLEKIDSLLKVLKRTSQMDREWIDKEEALHILECSERTLQTLRDNGSLSYSKPTGGSKFFYRRKDVMALFEKNFNGKI